MLLLLPGIVAIARDVGSFTPDLRDASISLADRFGPDDVLLTSAGLAEPTVPARLYGAYATLEAPDGTPLSEWPHLGDAVGCTLVNRLHEQRPDAERRLGAGAHAGARTSRSSRCAGPAPTWSRRTASTWSRGSPTPPATWRARCATAGRAYRAVRGVSQPVGDFGRVLADYRLAGALERAGICTS